MPPNLLMRFHDMRDFLKKWLPTEADLQKYPYLQLIMSRLRHAHVFRMDRRSVAKGVAFGLLVCYLPLPGQMLLAGLLACLCRANLSIAILITWISNPFTFVPINFFICQVGAWILGVKNTFPKISAGLQWTHESAKMFAHDLYLWFSTLGKVYAVGLPIVSIGSALLGYALVQLGWRVAIYWQRKHKFKPAI